MQQCNICSSNPNNKTYNYHTFEPDDYVKSARPSNGIIIEGLNTISQINVVTDSATSLNNSRSKHIECSLANKILCDDLNKQYNKQVASVADLDASYNDASKAYNTCDNHKQKCSGITTTTDIIQENIKDYTTKIDDKIKVLDKCDYLKTECNKKNKDIQYKETQIENLKIQINANKKLYELNKCGT
jgi:hypothetical protein